MKKYIAVILFPYFILINLYFFTQSGYLSHYSLAARLFIGAVFVLANVAELFFVIRCIVRSFKAAFAENADSLSIKHIIITKLCQIPAYILIFLIGFLCFPLRLGFLITLFCFIGDFWSIAITGLLMTTAMIAGLRRGVFSKRTAVIHSILAFIFCIDIVDGIYLLTKPRFGVQGK